MGEDFKGGGSDELQIKYFGIRLRALREKNVYRSQNVRRHTSHTRENHEEFRGVKTAKSKLYTSLIISQIVTKTSALSLSSVIGMYHPVCRTALGSGLGDYSYVIMNSHMHGTGARQFSCWFYIVTPSCKVPDRWIRDPTLHRTPTPLGSLSPIVTPSHAKKKTSYFRPRIRKPNIHFTSAVCFPFSHDFLLNVSLPAYRYSQMEHVIGHDYKTGREKGPHFDLNR